MRKLYRRYRKLRAAASERSVRLRTIESTEIRTYFGAQHTSNSMACLFASWDPHGRIDPYVIEYLKHLNECGFDIYFCTTSETLDEQDLSVALKFCKVITHRENVGLDFASWALLWRNNSLLKNYSAVLIANDSVFGPLHSLAPYIARMQQTEADLVGMTDNWEKNYHLQSYFVYFKKNILELGLLDTFMNSVQLSYDKEKIIERYEVGLTQLIIKSKLKVAALFPYLKIRAEAIAQGNNFQYADLILRQPCNSTIFMWKILIKEFKFPFLKTEILKLNRKESIDVVHWRTVLGEVSVTSDAEPLIINYIARTTANARI
jgi:rhamnosyltransferase